MFRRLLFLPVFLWLFAPVHAQNTTGYPLPDKLQPITPQNASQLQPLASIGGDLPGDLAWSADGKTLAVGTTGGVRLYDAADWKASPRQLPGWKDVRFDAAGNLISDGKVRDLRTGAVVHDNVPTSPSGKIGIAYRQQEGKAVVVLTDFASKKQTVLNTGLAGKVNRIAFSPDEQYAAILITPPKSPDGTLTIGQLWNAATGTRVATLDIPMFNLPIDTFTFHAQGKVLVFSGSSYDGDGMSYLVKIWDGRTGQEVPGTANAFVPIFFSPDDRWMAFPLWQDGIAFWSDHEIGKLGNFPMTPLFSPDSKLLVGYDTEQIRIWKTESVENQKEPDHVLTGGAIQNEVFFSPDSHWLAVDELDNLLRLWNVESGKVDTVISNITAPFQFSPDSRWILAKQADSGTSALWDARTGERLLQFTDNFAINPTWTMAAQWTANAAVQMIKLPTGEQVSALWVIDNPIGEVVQFDAGAGRVLFEGKAWDTLSGQSLFTTQIPTPLPDYPLSADWKRLLMVGNPFDSGSVSRAWAYVQEPVPADTAVRPRWFLGQSLNSSTTPFLTPDGEYIGYITHALPYYNDAANGQLASRLEFRNVESGEHLAEWALPGDVQIVTFTNDHRWLVLGSADYPDGWIIFLDLRRNLKQAVPLKLPMNIGDGDMTLLHIVFSPDDSSLAVGGYFSECVETCIQLSFVKTWNMHLLSDTPLDEASSTLMFDVHAPFYSADGNILVVFYSLGFQKYSIQVWNNTTGKQVAELKGDDGIGAFSPNGQLLAVHRDGNTLLYRVASLLKGHTILVATIPDKDKPVKELAFNSDGTILYGMSDNRLWLYGVPG